MCGADLSIVEEGGEIICTNRHSYAFTEDVPHLVLPLEKDSLTIQLAAWEGKRLDQGWGRLTDAEVKQLPFSDLPGFPPTYWKLQRAGYYKLVEFLKEGIPGSVSPLDKDSLVADVGCGLGWLASRISGLGYRVLAMDPLTEGPLGLLRGREVFGGNDNLGFAVGSAHNLPLRAGVWSLIIINAALQLMPDPEGTLKTLHGVLSARQQRDRLLLIMNTPLDAEGFIDRPDNRRSDRTLEVYLRSSGFETLYLDRSIVYSKTFNYLGCTAMVSRVLTATTKRTLHFPFILLRPRKTG